MEVHALMLGECCMDNLATTTPEQAPASEPDALMGGNQSESHGSYDCEIEPAMHQTQKVDVQAKEEWRSERVVDHDVTMGGWLFWEQR